MFRFTPGQKMQKILPKKPLSLYALVLLGVLEVFSSAYAASDDDYNFSWLDPEKKIYVLQNRKYRKANALHLSLLGGPASGDPYRTIYNLQPRMGYWLSEEFGIEAFYEARFHQINNTYRGMIAAALGGAGETPLIREITSQFGVLMNWAPWYAKINVFNSVLYFDWYFSFGVGGMTSQIGPKTKDDPVVGYQWKNENLFAVYLGTGHLFHVSENVFVRLDALGHFYSAPVYGGINTSGSANQVSNSALYSTWTYNLGVGLKL